MLETSRNLIVIATALVLALAPIENISAQNPTEMEIFLSQKFGVIEVRFDATGETVPGENITVHLWMNSRAMDVTIVSFEFNIYGFEFGREKILLDSKMVMQNENLSVNEPQTHNYTVSLPADVWGATYTDLHLNYTIPNMSIPSYEHGFFTTIVRNTYLEELENTCEVLNQTYQELNKTYWDLKQNYTSFQGNQSELENTRTVAIILGIATVFFVATTIYLIWRKPKEYW